MGVRREGWVSLEPPSRVWWCREGERRGRSSQDGGNEHERLDREVGGGTGVAEGVGENSIATGTDAAPSETGGGGRKGGKTSFQPAPSPAKEADGTGHWGRAERGGGLRGFRTRDGRTAGKVTDRVTRLRPTDRLFPGWPWPLGTEDTYRLADLCQVGQWDLIQTELSRGAGGVGAVMCGSSGVPSLALAGSCCQAVRASPLQPPSVSVSGTRKE